ncbi:MAG TPA: hypothetical protein VD816_18520 [Ohtaekwangia sp.]|nr:hypothetical protein [Ohtaekwangia sp.]
MRFLLFLIASVTPAAAQLQPTAGTKTALHFPAVTGSLFGEKPGSALNRLLPADPQRYYRLSSPLLSQRAHHDYVGSSGGYWTGYITTQSLNQGAVGTFYFWDVQGNLRESRSFVQIKRKNKSFFKLVVPRR